MFVDDTDLFFSGSRGMTDEDFLSMVQEGINDWARTVISTGGNIKIVKSHAKLSVTRHVRGQRVTKNIKSLPVQTFTVPQRSGPDKPIEILSYKTGKSLLESYLWVTESP